MSRTGGGMLPIKAIHSRVLWEVADRQAGPYVGDARLWVRRDLEYHVHTSVVHARSITESGVLYE